MTDVASLSELDRWYGGFPGEHEYSTLEQMGINLEEVPPSEDPDLELFAGAVKMIQKRWRGNKFAGMYLYGEPGTGKTHAAIGLGRILHELGAEVHYDYVPELKPEKADLLHWTAERFGGSSENQISKSGQFPSRFSQKTTRNPMHVAILDDYRPDKQAEVATGVEAAAQYGGFVVITSNYPDPLQLVETMPDRPQTDEQAAYQAFIRRTAPETAEQLDSQRLEAAVNISNSLRSRIAAGFRLLEFSGPDRRQEHSFWGD